MPLHISLIRHRPVVMKTITSACGDEDNHIALARAGPVTCNSLNCCLLPSTACLRKDAVSKTQINSLGRWEVSHVLLEVGGTNGDIVVSFKVS
jgi:hypothetical protein